MCFFCCDMLCWFSAITCCGCRDFVTRKLVFFPPKPYYEHIEPNEDFQDFYHRISSKKKHQHEHHHSADTESESIILEVSPKQTSTNQTEMEALNSSDDNSLNAKQRESKLKKHRKRKHVQTQNKNVNKDNFGTFRIKSDDENLAQFYWKHYKIKMSDFHSQFLYTNRGETIASYYIRHPSAKYVILFSHGNAADIGLMRNHLCRMYEKCKVSIFAYEYSGYGQSSGKPSEKNTYCDIETAYKYVRDTLEYKPCHIVAYGQSLGTCLSVYLSSKYPVGGVILHSPLMSGLRVMQPLDKTYWFDLYPVVEQIQHVFAPIFVIHGNRDKEIDVIHGKILSKLAPNAYKPWFVPYAGHNDIEVMFPDALFKKICKFLRYLRRLKVAYLYFDDKDDFVPEEDDEMDTEFEKYPSGKTKSIKTMNTDQSISPPPPQSIMTKSMERVNYKLTLPSRKFSNTAVSNSEQDELEESALKTPSVGTSLSIKDSALISMSMNRDYDKNAVLTPTMRTIHSKEVESSLNSEMFALPTQIDDSRTMFPSQTNKSRKSRRNLMSFNGGIDEEEKSDLMTIKWKNERKQQQNKKRIAIKMPNGQSMKENIDNCWKRRENLLVGNNAISESESDDEDIDIVNEIELSSSSNEDADDDDDDDVISEAL